MTPLVFEALNWQHGVFMGATMASERTAAQVGKQGEVRYDPMAMLPFCGYNMGDYFEHWLSMGKKMGKRAPKIFCVNWFRRDDQGKFLWPGYGENLRVIDWILSRCHGETKAEETAIGLIPQKSDINLEGLDLPKENLGKLLNVNTAEWQEELVRQGEFLKNFGDRLPNELRKEHENLKNRLA